MGVEQMIRDAFRAALDYKHENENFTNSKLQRTKACKKILLMLSRNFRGTRRHCQTYRQMRF